MDPFFVGIWGPNLRFGDQILRRVDQKKLKISRKSISKRKIYDPPLVGPAFEPSLRPAVRGIPS